MPHELVPSTELDAVNQMLGTIGESPISNLEDDNGIDAATARDMLHALNREIQGTGFWFNKDDDYTFVLDSNSQVTPPSNILSMRPSGQWAVVVRGGKLWDRRNKTDTFTEAPHADVTWFLSFDDLPESARRYIAIRASRIFQTQVLGSESQDVFTEEHERAAWLTLAAEQDDNTFSEGYSYLNSDQATSDIWNK